MLTQDKLKPSHFDAFQITRSVCKNCSSDLFHKILSFIVTVLHKVPGKIYSVTYFKKYVFILCKKKKR